MPLSLPTPVPQSELLRFLAHVRADQELQQQLECWSLQQLALVQLQDS